MKRSNTIWIASILIAAVLLAGLFFSRELWLDYLPIDQSGWYKSGGTLYHVGSKGDPDSGWLNDGGKIYYLADDGAMQTGWQEIEGKRYHFSNVGTMDTGWLALGESVYYFEADGQPHVGFLSYAPDSYYFSESGTLCFGWTETEQGRIYADHNGRLLTGWQTVDGDERYFSAGGILQTGAIEIDGKTHFLDENGCRTSGWVRSDTGIYYVLSDGSLQTGWMEDQGSRYYFQEDGKAAVGKVVIDDKYYYFNSKGVNFELINRWNPISDDYEPNLVDSQWGSRVDASCLEALDRMLMDCREAGYYPNVISGYRSYWDQKSVLDEKVKEYGYASAITIAAIPGTSEHHLGLAVDITDSLNTRLNKTQSNTATQRWLMEHCWDYGFILRYPDGSSDYTGIIFEPWHYRYVGLEFAQEMKELGICLEEYIDRLTNDGTSCGGIDK